MNPIAQSGGLMTAVEDYGEFIIGTLENHAAFLLTLTGIAVVYGLIRRKL